MHPGHYEQALGAGASYRPMRSDLGRMGGTVSTIAPAAVLALGALFIKARPQITDTRLTSRRNLQNWPKPIGIFIAGWLAGSVAGSSYLP